MSEGITVEHLLAGELRSAREAIPALQAELRAVEEEWHQVEIARSHVAAGPERFSPEERQEVTERADRLLGRRGELQTWLKTAVERVALIEALRESIAAEMQALHAELERARQQASAPPEPPPPPEPEPAGLRAPSALEIHEAVEAERLRIARDLHDGPAQVLSNLVLEAEILERLLRRNPELVQAEIQDFRNQVTNAVADVRRFMFDLRPDSLDDLGLVATLRRFTTEWQQRTGVTCRLNLTGDEIRLPPRLEEALYRIVQEALTNVRRHAEARLVEVHLELRSDRARLRVRDDGRGFDTGQMEDGAGPRRLGVRGMRERAESVGGTLEVTSTEGGGTEVNGEFRASS